MVRKVITLILGPTEVYEFMPFIEQRKERPIRLKNE